MAGPRVVVNGPDFTPLSYGLWDAVQKPTPEGTHWQNGITWSEWCGGGDTLYDECIAVTGSGGSPSGQASMTSNITQTNRGATSFACYAEFDCSPVGLADAQTIAQNALDKIGPYQLERAFWTGVAGKTSSGGVAQNTVFPHLASSSAINDPNSTQTIVLQPAATMAVTGSGGPDSDPANSLGALEASLASCYHGKGVIHMSPGAFPTFAAWELVEDDGSGALYTKAGNRVVVGQGYTGSAPSTPTTAPAVGTSWIYATGPVFGYQAPLKIPSLTEQFDRSENTYHLLAQQVYVLGFECCLIASFVTLGVPT